MVQVQVTGQSAEELGAGVTSHAKTAWQGNAKSGSRFSRIAVFCGASEGTSPVYMAAAQALGEELARRGQGLVYGGGSVGLMGKIASTVYDLLGEGSVIGVIPAALEPREVSGAAVGEVRIVPDMHTRKAEMAAEADAFVCLPGGYGTLEEMLEMVTWLQLGFHEKPVALLNINGFYEHLLGFFDHCVTEGFVRPSSRDMLISGSTPAEVLDALEAFQPPPSIIKLAEAGQLPANSRG